MRALSIRQPWAWLILNAGKDIENRDWQPCNPALRFRGPCLIHAGIAVQPISDELRAWVKQTSGVDLPRSDELPRGGIVGQVDIIDVVGASSSPWFEGPCGLVLTNPKPLPLFGCPGRLGFFEISQ
jgi:ASCH domain